MIQLINFHTFLSLVRILSYVHPADACWLTNTTRSNQTSFSVIIIVAAIAGPLWISTEERIPFYTVNSTFYRSNFSLSYIIKSSNSSLWIFCTRQGELNHDNLVSTLCTFLYSLPTLTIYCHWIPSSYDIREREEMKW